MPTYRGLEVLIPSNDPQHIEYLRLVATHKTVVLQRCASCGHLRYPPGPACPACRSLDVGWVPASGRGTIISYALVPHAINPAFADWLPYTLATIELDEQRDVANGRGLRVVANIVTAAGEPEAERNVAIGKRVQATVVDLGDGMALPQFLLSEEPPEHTPWQWSARPD